MTEQKPTQSHSKPLIIFVLIALILRLTLAGVSTGTNDAGNWRRIATEVRDHGFFEAYRIDPEINHPPLMVLWSRVALIGGSPRNIALLMKIPAILGDVLSIWLLWKIWMKRDDPRRATLAAFAMALSPVAILVSGYHCNTDNLYAFLSLLAMYLVADRRSFLLAGLALGSAINVKLIPVILIPGIYSLCRSWRDAIRLTLGLAIWVIPFVPLMINAFDVMKRNMFEYRPPYGEWGIATILHTIFDSVPENSSARTTVHDMMTSYQSLGSWLILIGIITLSCISFRARRWNAYQIGAISYALMLILAPGFGYQYAVILVPMLLAVSIWLSWAWGVLVGLFIGCAYYSRLVGGLPMESAFIQGTPTPPGALFGLLGWMVLVATTVWLLLSRRKTQSSGY